MIRNGEAMPVCPEQMGGLTTPRDPAECLGDKIVTIGGAGDITAECRKGAEEALKLAKLAGCKEAILKSKSPSCGCGKIYDGTFTGTLTDGDGIFTELLKENGITVLTEDEI